MRTLRLVTACLLGAMVVGCASVKTPTSAPASGSGAPTAVAGYDWFFHTDGDEALLAYGVEASDDLKLGLSCAKGGGKLSLEALAPAGSREIHLESGGDTERFAAHAEPSQLHEGEFLTAEAETKAPVFQRFRRLAWLARWTGERRETYVAHPGTVADVERFFAFCG